MQSLQPYSQVPLHVTIFFSTQSLARKLSRLDEDAEEAVIAVKNETTSTTAHSDLAEIVRFSRKECDSAMDYFASVMDLYRPGDGVITRAQADAANLTELQTKNFADLPQGRCSQGEV